MNDVVVARRYARAVFRAGAAAADPTREWDGVTAFAAAYAAVADLKRILDSPAVPYAEKEALLAKTVPEGTARDLARILLRKGRLTLIALIGEELGRLRREADGIIRVEVTTALPAGQEWLGSLAAVLERLTGKKVALMTRVDAAVIGGVKLMIGDVAVDGTLAGRLRGLREKLTAIAS